MSDTKNQVQLELSDQFDSQLRDIIKDGVCLTDQNGSAVLDSDGRPMKNPAPAAYFAVARARLKDLGIDKIPVSSDPVMEMASMLRLEAVPPPPTDDLEAEACA